LENLTPKFDAMLKISFIVVVILAIVDINFAKIFSRFRNYEPINNNIINVNEEMKLIYKSKMLPLEEYYLFNEFYPKLEDGYFNAKPTLVLVGQYSTGTVFNFHHFLFFDISAFLVFFLKNLKNKYFPANRLTSLLPNS
jgi:hypothetical protein